MDDFFTFAYGAPDPAPASSSSAAPPPRPVSDAPEAFRSVFPFQNFNAIQSSTFDSVVNSDESIVVSAPTGSGKTVILELAMCRFFQDQLSVTQQRRKCVYIAPLKALCEEKFNSWSSKFGSLGLRCVQLTGDTRTSIPVLMGADIFVTTPEKWDSMTRQWLQHQQLMDSVGLVLIDEVHLLNEARGASLEGLITRCKLKRAESDQSVRFVAVSATIPNHDDLAEWLDARAFFFGPEFRPVPLDYHVVGYREWSSKEFLFDKSLNKHLMPLIRQHSGGQPALIFCTSRRACKDAAQHIVGEVAHCRLGDGFVRDAAQQTRLKAASQRAKDAALRKLIVHGVGIHTAGLGPEDRHLVQQLFVARDLSVVACTTTLSLGINLPARLVIVKSTKLYQSTVGYVDTNPSLIRQMIGRAGRPQFDDTGVAVVMTGSSSETKYLNAPHINSDIESTLTKNMAGHVNAEIAIGTVRSRQQLMAWAKATFWSVRARKNPAHYGISATGLQLDNEIARTVTRVLERLHAARLVEFDDSDERFHATDRGRLMAKYYLSVDTMQIMNELVADDGHAPHATVDELMRALCRASEFADSVRIRLGDKGILNAANRGKKHSGSGAQFPTPRYSLKGKSVVQELPDKVFVVLQCLLVGGSFSGTSWDLQRDAFEIHRTAMRVSSCLRAFLKSSSFAMRKNSWLLHRSIEKKIWPRSPRQIEQLARVGPSLRMALQSQGVQDLRSLAQLSTTQIAELLSRRFAFAKAVSDQLAELPLFSLDTQVLEKTDQAHRISLTVSVSCGKPSGQQALLLAGTDSGIILLDRRLTVSSTETTKTLQVSIPVAAPGSELTVLLLPVNTVGIDVIQHVQYTGSRKKQPTKSKSKKKRASSSKPTNPAPAKKPKADTKPRSSADFLQPSQLSLLQQHHQRMLERREVPQRLATQRVPVPAPAPAPAPAPSPQFASPLDLNQFRFQPSAAPATPAAPSAKQQPTTPTFDFNSAFRGLF